MRTIDGLIQNVQEFIRNSSRNRVEELGGMKIFDTPLIGIADAKDPLFGELKKPEIIGTQHLLPTEWLPGAKSVISYFLPFSDKVRSANRVEGMPSIEWLYGRIEGEECNNELGRYILSELIAAGEEAVFPIMDSRFTVTNRRSNWSERHVAYIAGLGTFGLSKSLITKEGCAGRYGSIITTLALEPTQRQYNTIYEYCTFCNMCIERCPSGAITAEGKNTAVCSDYMDNEIKPRFAPRYGCGKCQTAVPCENALP